MSEALPAPTETDSLPEEAGWLGFEATVPRALVHKRAVSEVLVTDSRQLSPDEVICAAQLPPMHRLHGPRAGHHELVTIAEATRQAVELLAHRHLEVPRERSFVFRSIDLRAFGPSVLRTSGGPAELILHAHLRDRRSLAGSLASFGLVGKLHIDGRPLGLGSGSCAFLRPEDYLALRTPSARPPGASSSPGEAAGAAVTPRLDAIPKQRRADAQLVGRHEADVVLSVPRQTIDVSECELVPDLTHAGFFDHPQDHLPGALLLEGMRQLAVARAVELWGEPAERWVLTRCAASFERFAELDRTVLLSAAGGRTEQGLQLTLRVDQDAAGGRDEVARGEVVLEHV